MPLTLHQQAAYRQLVRFASGETAAGIALLRGYAGTGKTFVVEKLVKKLAQARPDLKVCVAAPTHKALSVLAEKIDVDVSFRTLHSLLGYKMTANEDVRTTTRANPPNISQFDLVIVDEASMVGAVFFADLLNYRHATLVLFVGDPAQLPPVGEAIRSPVFDRVQMQVMLSEVVRQAAENPIIALSMAVRAAQEIGVCMDARAIISHVPEGAYNIGTCQREVLASWAIEEHKDGRDCRIIAYTNHRVLALNSDIHEALHGGSKTPFVTGERVIVHESRESVCSEDCPGIRVSLRTSEELIVRSAEWKGGPFGEDLHLVVEREGGAKVKGIWLDQEKQAETQRRFSEAKEKTEKSARGRAFQSAFAYRESFLDLRHAYAMTVHKSQGSTFDTALIDFPDLQRMPQSDFNRALYVAITRPREFLGIGT